MHHKRSPFLVASLARNSKCASRSLTRVRAHAWSCSSVSFVMNGLSVFFARTGYSTGFKNHAAA